MFGRCIMSISRKGQLFNKKNLHPLKLIGNGNLAKLPLRERVGGDGRWARPTYY